MAAPKNIKEDILRMYDEGKKYDEIVQVLHCSKSTICYHLQGNRAKEKRKLVDKKCKNCPVIIPKYIVRDGKRVNQNNRVYCEACSEKRRPSQFHENRKCAICKEVLNIDNSYICNGKIQSYCKKCNLKDTVRRNREFKQKCINYKGGCCQKCRYDKCPNALEFHHLDPSQKDFIITHRRYSFHKVIPELDKCILLCSNCHREEHYRIQFEKELSSAS